MSKKATAVDVKEEEIAGTVEAIHYATPKFSAGRLYAGGRRVSFSVKGLVRQGYPVTLRGQWENNPKYGRQFVASQVVATMPADTEGVRAWLEAYAHGIGPVKARQAVDTFGVDLMRLVAEDPQQVAIELRLPIEFINRIATLWSECSSQTNTLAGLLGKGLTQAEAESLYEKYQGSAVAVIEADPYSILGEVPGFGWKRVDEMGRRVGIKPNDPRRMVAAVVETVRKAFDDGSTAVKSRDVLGGAADFLGGAIEPGDVVTAAAEAVERNRLVQFGELAYALPHAARTETTLWRILRSLTKPNPFFRDVRDEELHPPGGHRLDDSQLAAVRMAMSYRGMVITGGAGCLSGSTMVGVNRRGSSYQCRLDYLVYMMNGGKSSGHRFDMTIPTTARQMMVGENLVGLGVIASASYSGDKTTYRILTDDGREVRATGCHRFLTPNGWVRVDQFRDGEVVMVDCGKTSAGRATYKSYHHTCSMSNHPYSRKSTRTNGYAMWRVRTHRLVVEAKLNGIPFNEMVELIRSNKLDGLVFLDPSLWHVHHKDGNRTNNNIDNLEVMSIAAHHRLHALESWRNCQSVIGTATVLSVDTPLVEPTFDLTMEDEDNQNFLANGFVVHNSGKTTIAKAIYRQYAAADLEVAVTSPTGKAAHRIGSVIKCEASTIHRLLGYNPSAPGHSQFTYDENNCLPHQLVIVDEVSMCDSSLLTSLLRAVSPTSVVVLIGDPNQLPPVGAGFPLRDILTHDLCPIARLDKCHRQAGALAKATSALLVGVMHPTDIENDPPGWAVNDRHNGTESMLATVEFLFAGLKGKPAKLKDWGYGGLFDSQFMTAMHKGQLGTMAINELLQRLHQKTRGVILHVRNPAEERLPILVGDKVIQTKNDYQLGVMSGTLGRVVQDKPLIVAFDNGEPDDADWPEKNIPAGSEGLVMLAYCLTPHRMQGSQAKCAVSIVPKLHSFMQHRNWLYTACTRPSGTSVVIGDSLGVKQAVEKVEVSTRRTVLELFASHEEVRP